MTQAGIGRSNSLDTFAAAREAWDQARAPLDGAPSCVIVFATSGYELEPLVQTLRTLAPEAALVGCSAEGVVTQGRSDEVDHALGIMAIRSDRLCFDALLVDGYGASSVEAGRELARRVVALGRESPLALLVFPDGISGDCSAFLDALGAGLPTPIPIAGGAAADALRMDRTQQFAGNAVRTGAVSALLISGSGRAAVAVGHGCRPIGRARSVTRVADGWVAALDERPAWDWFRRYLEGEPEDLRADGIMHLSVGLLGEGADDSSVVRTPMLLRKEDGALFFPGGGIREGARIRLVRRDASTMCESARDTGRAIADAGDGARPDLVLQFDCSGRGKLLFGSDTAGQIVEPVQQIVGKDVPWLGFHTYGEIAPLEGRARYHNYTVALLAIFPPSP